MSHFIQIFVQLVISYFISISTLTEIHESVMGKIYIFIIVRFINTFVFIINLLLNCVSVGYWLFVSIKQNNAKYESFNFILINIKYYKTYTFFIILTNTLYENKTIYLMITS